MSIVSHSYKVSLGSTALSGTPTYSELSTKVTSVTAPSITVDPVEVSHMQSPDQFKEYLFIWKDGGTVEVECHKEASVYTAAKAVFGVVRAWKFEDEEGNTVVSDGAITEMGEAPEREGIIMLNFSIKLTGPQTFTAAA